NAEQGKTVVLTTHYLEEAEELCERVAIMDESRIVALDTPSGLIATLDADARVSYTDASGNHTVYVRDVQTTVLEILERARQSGDTVENLAVQHGVLLHPGGRGGATHRRGVFHSDGQMIERFEQALHARLQVGLQRVAVVVGVVVQVIHRHFHLADFDQQVVVRVDGLEVEAHVHGEFLGEWVGAEVDASPMP